MRRALRGRAAPRSTWHSGPEIPGLRRVSGCQGRHREGGEIATSADFEELGTVTVGPLLGQPGTSGRSWAEAAYPEKLALDSALLQEDSSRQ